MISKIFKKKEMKKNSKGNSKVRVLFLKKTNLRVV